MSPSNPAIAPPRRTLVPVFAACAAIGLQAGVGMPLVPLALEQQGHDKLTIGLVSALAAITRARVTVERQRAESAAQERSIARRLMVQSLLSLTETRDAETGRHSYRTQQYA